MPAVQIKQAPPPLNCAVQHSEHADECGELAGRRGTPLLHHQVTDFSRLPFAYREVLSPPEPLAKQRTPPLKSGSVKCERYDHQKSGDNGEGVGGAVSQQESPIQLHILQN